MNTLWILESIDDIKFYPLAFTAKTIAELHSFHPNLSIIFGGGSYYEIREYIENEFPHEFTLTMLRESFPDIPESTFQRVLRDLKKGGTIQPHGRGKKSYWSKTL